jgi:hypothetical protein
MDREKNIAAALRDLEDGQFKSFAAAAQYHQVPRTTLLARKNGAKSRRLAHGNQQTCAPEEEEALVRWAERQTAQGFPLRHDMLRLMAKELILNRINGSRRNTISTHLTSRNWPARFLKRYPHLKTVVSDKLDKPRHKACTAETFNQWFEVFRSNFRKYMPQSQHIYNIDETGFSMGENSKAYVIVDTTQTCLGQSVEGAKGEWVTVIECVSAAGTAIPPFVIFKGKFIQSNWFQPNTPKDWMISLSPKGWTNNALGLKWLEIHFEPHTRPQRKTDYRFLILDGHSSHLTPEFQEFCRNHRIILLCLPAHTSHMLQPLDVAVFSSLKHWYRREVDSRLRLGDIRVPKSEFLSIYAEARPRAFTDKNICSGFRKTGIVPFNPGAALRLLPTLDTNPPDPVVSLHLQTPRNQEDLNRAKEHIGNGDETPVRVARKVCKRAGILEAENFILRTEIQQYRAHIAKKQEVKSRKRKRVPYKGPVPAGEVLDTVVSSSHKGTTTRATKRQKAATPPPEAEDDCTSLEGDIDDDINSCILAVTP